VLSITPIRLPQIALLLASLGALGLSACAKTPEHGIMTMHLPTPTETSREKKSKFYATPAPGTEPKVAASPAPTLPVKTDPNKWVRPEPSPAPSISPWNPFPIYTPTPPVVVPVKPPATSDLLNEIFTRRFAQAFGVYDRGSLEHADKIPLLGEGYLKIFQDRDRGYGTLDLISVIVAAAKEIHRDIPATEAVQVGDVASKMGGRLGRHGSHQNGLDADIAYFKKDHRVMNVARSSAGETGFDEKFVDRRGNVIPNFDIEANWRFIQILVATKQVDRIFADQHIKREFCRYAVAKGMREEWKETLRKIRHWKNHQDHMHVRVTCPPNSPMCKPIPTIPEGDGCDFLLLERSNRPGILRMEGELLPPNEGDVTVDEHGC
jgi:penicillin-insensitive murein endopeptidase